MHKTLAQDDAREALLGAMLISRNAIDAAIEAGIGAERFPKGPLQMIYKTIIGLHGVGATVDSITTLYRIELDNPWMNRADRELLRTRIHTLAATVPSLEGVRDYAQIVVEAEDAA